MEERQAGHILALSGKINNEEDLITSFQGLCFLKPWFFVILEVITNTAVIPQILF